MDLWDDFVGQFSRFSCEEPGTNTRTWVPTSSACCCSSTICSSTNKLCALDNSGRQTKWSGDYGEEEILCVVEQEDAYLKIIPIESSSQKNLLLSHGALPSTEAHVVSPSPSTRSNLNLPYYRNLATPLPSAPSGFKWRCIGAVEPTKGQSLSNPELANALATKAEFSEGEWATFGISDLRIDDYIKAGSSYFKPAASVQKRGNSKERIPPANNVGNMPAHRRRHSEPGVSARMRSLRPAVQMRSVRNFRPRYKRHASLCMLLKVWDMIDR